MATIKKTIQNLKPGKQYLLTVKPKDADINASLDPTSAVRFEIPLDVTQPADLGNLVIVGNYKSIMISFNPSNEDDLKAYNYQVYLPESISQSGSTYVINSGATPYLSGVSASNVITIDVPQNSETTNNVNANTGVTTTTTTPKLYFGRVQSVDTTGNTSAWTPIVASTATTFIESAHIIDLTASKITAGTIGAHTITMAGVNSILKSSNYQAANTTFGGTGWKISGDGNAVFNNASIRSSLDIGEDLGTSDATSFHVDVTGNMWSGANSTSFAVAPFRVTNTGEVTARTLTLTGNTILSQTDDSKIYLGVGVYNNTNTPFYVDSDSQFSLGNKLTWDGSSLTVSGNINITGGNTLTLIGNAESNANIAYTAALSASGLALTANTNAGNAYTAALTAQSLALTANTNAGSAYTAALSANSLALTASTKADDAQGTADDAYTTANTKITAGGAAFDVNGNSTNITGDKIRSGSIIANNFASSINLDDGTFSFGSGAISWNGGTLDVNGDITGCSGTFSGTLYALNATVQNGYSYRAEGGFPTAGTGDAVGPLWAQSLSGQGVQRIVRYTSLRDTKENIEDMSNGLSIINNLRARIFSWKMGDIDPVTNEPWTDQAKDLMSLNRSYGFIVEEVLEAQPELVTFQPPSHELPWDEEGGIFDINAWKPAMWNTIEIIPILVKAIQELSDKVNELESKVI